MILGAHRVGKAGVNIVMFMTHRNARGSDWQEADQTGLTRICRDRATCTTSWSDEEEQRVEKFVLLDQSAPETASRCKTLPKVSKGPAARV